jgi:hypothetical protein
MAGFSFKGTFKAFKKFGEDFGTTVIPRVLKAIGFRDDVAEKNGAIVASIATGWATLKIEGGFLGASLAILSASAGSSLLAVPVLVVASGVAACAAALAVPFVLGLAKSTVRKMGLLNGSEKDAKKDAGSPAAPEAEPTFDASAKIGDNFNKAVTPDADSAPATQVTPASKPVENKPR